jgi:hypothetical protein
LDPSFFRNRGQQSGGVTSDDWHKFNGYKSLNVVEYSANQASEVGELAVPPTFFHFFAFSARTFRSSLCPSLKGEQRFAFSGKTVKVSLV